jgi:hypothetical protein
MSSFPSYYAQPEPFYGQTVVEITVPSGKLIVSDDLRRTPTFDIDPQQSINYGAGCDAYSKLQAEQVNVAYASVGNTCPSITVDADGLIQIVTLDWTQETGPIFENNEVSVGTICTSHWAAMATDYQHWLDNGGKPIDEANAEFKFDTYFVLDVEPGKYRWTVFSHSDRFNSDEPGRHVYAHLELIEAY